MARTSVVLPAPSSPDSPTTVGRRSRRAKATPHAERAASSNTPCVAGGDSAVTPPPPRPPAAPPARRGAVRARPRRRSLRRRVAAAVRRRARLQVQDLVADLRRQLVVEVVGRAPHLLLQRGD